MTQILITLQITIFTYIFIGWVLYKVHLIDEKAKVFLSDFVIRFLLPVSVFVSCVRNLSKELLLNCGKLLLLAIFIEAVIYYVAMKYHDDDLSDAQNAVVRYCMLVSNGGFIGTPVIEGLLGQASVVYCNVFLMPTRVMAYSAGESIFNPEKRKGVKDAVKHLLSNEILIAMMTGLLISFIGIPIPDPIMNAFDSISKCLSPISLILVGSIMGEKFEFDVHILKNLAKLILLRLIVIPSCVMLLCKVLSLDLMTSTIAVLLMGMPAGSTCVIFAKKYHSDSSFASAAVVLSTLLSSITLVLLMGVLERLFV